MFQVLATLRPMEDEGAKKVNFKIPADRVKGILSVGEEWRSRQALDARELQDRQKIAFGSLERRIVFFEKLILLAGGSFALSLAFVGSLHRHELQNTRLEHLGLLETAWILMLICMGISWLHNWYLNAALDNLLLGSVSWDTSFQHVENARFAKQASTLFEGISAEGVDFEEFYALIARYLETESKKETDRASKFRDSAKNVLTRASSLGNLAPIAAMVAFTLLLSFAIVNISLL
jgi:hypothetical protein